MGIDRISKPLPQEFKKTYVKQQTPVILTNAIESWPAKQLWSPTYFQENFGDAILSVESFNKKHKTSDSDYYLKHLRHKNISLKDYIDFAASPDALNGENYLYLAQQPLTNIIPELSHHIKPLGYYSEWLRSLVRLKTLAWIGAKGCVSSLHYDPFPNFVAQIWGHKRWVIYPKHQQSYLYVPSNLKPSYFSPIDYEHPDYQKYPNYRHATAIEFTLNPGEVLYLPEGWVHYVRSLDLSIAINIWWIPWAQAIPIGYRLIYHLMELHTLQSRVNQS